MKRGTVVCRTCVDAGWVIDGANNDFQDKHRLIRCPECQGHSAQGRDDLACALYLIERQRIKQEAAV